MVYRKFGTRALLTQVTPATSRMVTAYGTIMMAAHRAGLGKGQRARKSGGRRRDSHGRFA